MPTAAKLAAAFLFAVVSLFTGLSIMELMPQGMLFGMFLYVCCGIGLLVGWRFMGRRVGRGYPAAAGAGAATMFVVVFWGLFVFSANEMVMNSIHLRYDGPFDAVSNGFGIAAKYAVVLADPTVLALLVVGGSLSGLVVEWVSRRWP